MMATRTKVKRACNFVVDGTNVLAVAEDRNGNIVAEMVIAWCSDEETATRLYWRLRKAIEEETEKGDGVNGKTETGHN